MRSLSIVRGLVAAFFPALTLSLAALSGDLAHWLPILIPAHLLLPVIAAFSGRRADPLGVDIALATLASVYLIVMLYMPRGAWPGSTYVGVAIAYTLYALFAAALFASMATLRTAIRVQGWKRLRAQRVTVRAEPADAE